MGSPEASSSLAVAAHYSIEFGSLTSVYGHLWHAIDIFFQCVVQERQRAARPTDTTTLYVPAHHDEVAGQDIRHFEIFRELSILFSGESSQLRIERAPWVPSCHGPDQEALRGRYDGPCCMNRSAMTRTARRLGLPRPALQQLELRTWPSPNPVARALGVSWRPWEWRRLPSGAPAQTRRSFLHAMRRTVWSNLRLTNRASDTVLFASSEGGSNGRRIADEPLVAQAVRRYVASRRPDLRFRYVALHQLPYEQELLELRRARVFVSLFGSTLHVRYRRYLGLRAAHIYGRYLRYTRSLHLAFRLAKSGRTASALRWHTHLWLAHTAARDSARDRRSALPRVGRTAYLSLA